VLRTYIKPTLLSTSSLIFPSCVAARLTKSLAETYRDRRHNPSIPTLQVNPAPPPLPYLLPLSPAPPLTFLFLFKSQLIELLIDDRRHPRSPPSPATLRHRRRTQSLTPTKQTRSPSSSARRPSLPRHHRSPEPSPSSTTEPQATAGDRKPCISGEPSSPSTLTAWSRSYGTD
jgi:hypothetical protein